MWPYAWILPVTVGSISIATNVIISGYPKLGGLLIAFALAVLLMAVLHDYLTRFDRRHAYYSVDGDKLSRQFTYPQFKVLPDNVRRRLLLEKEIDQWQKRTVIEYGARLFAEHETRSGRLFYRLREAFLKFLTDP